MVKAIRFHAPGGPEVLRWDDIDVGDPGDGQIRVRHTAVGLNYIDTYHRSGLYPLPLPSVIGMEGAGVVEAVGSGVDTLSEGDRVAYASPPPGSYAEARVIAAGSVVKVPDGIDDDTAAAMMLKGLTAQYLLRRTHAVRAGETVLLHAAAGGVGLIACQWAKHLGATVIGTVGTPEKAELARAHGCDHPILYDREDFVARVKELTGGKGADVIYDSVGGDVFDRSLKCIAWNGRLLVIGFASGTIPTVKVNRILLKNIAVTGLHWGAHMTNDPELIPRIFDALFELFRAGAIKPVVFKTYSLDEVSVALEALSSRKTYGKVIVAP